MVENIDKGRGRKHNNLKLSCQSMIHSSLHPFRVHHYGEIEAIHINTEEKINLHTIDYLLPS